MPRACKVFAPTAGSPIGSRACQTSKRNGRERFVRYALAVILIVLGLVAGGIGVLQKTLWAPSDTITASATVKKSGDLIVVEPGVLNLYETPATLTIKSHGDLSISRAKADDVKAWVGNSPHTDITGLKSEHRLATTAKKGTAPPADPRGDDLWVKQSTGTNTMSMKWDRDAGRTAFLIASDAANHAGDKNDKQADKDSGTKSAAKSGTEVSISWPSHATTPWAVPLMVIGGVLLLLGLILLTVFFIDGSRRRKRRKKRAFRHKNAATPGGAAMIAGALVLAGCSAPPELPKPSPSASPAEAQPVLTKQQLHSVLDKISAATEAGDKAKSADKLGDRVTGPALSKRKAIYRLEKKKATTDKPTPVAAEPVLLNVTTATRSWPRITVVVTKGKDADVPQLLDLYQKDPRSPYQLWSSVKLLPGVQVPPTPSPKRGSALMPPDAGGLEMTPQDAAKRYADVLTKGSKSKYAKAFAPDSFRKKLLNYQKQQKESLKSAKATVEYEHKANPQDMVVTEAGNNGALVLAHLSSKTTIKPESVDGRTGSITVPDKLAKLLGEKTTHSPVRTKYSETVLFFVPKKSSGHIKVLGVDNTLTGGKTL